MTSHPSPSSSSAAASEIPFACNLCLVSFQSNADQRTHMQTPWHVYNLKRRIASLPPITSTTFEETILAVQKSDVSANDEFRAECSTCQKVYDKPKAYQNHLRSQGHKLATLERGENLKESVFELRSPVQDLADIASNLEALNISEHDSDESGSEEMDETEDEKSPDFDETFCLFCLHESPDLEQIMAHMRKSHGLFIPDPEYISDLPALLKYLHLIIVEFHDCLYCGSTKGSAEAARAHMISKGHCTVKSEDLEDFYEYSDDESAGGAEEDTDNPKESKTLVPEDDKLTLPSGKQLGHRSKSHIYRQHLPSPEVRAQRKAIADSETETSNASQSNNRKTHLIARAKDGMGIIGISEFEKRNLRAVEKRMMRVEIRARNEFRAGLERAVNRQKYYRSDVPGPPLGI